MTVSLDALYNRRSEFSRFPLALGGNLAAAHGEAAALSRSFAVAPSLEWSIGEDRTDFRNDNYTGANRDSRSAGCYCNKAQSIELSGNGSLARLPSGEVKAAFGN